MKKKREGQGRGEKGRKEERKENGRGRGEEVGEVGN